MMVAKKAAAKKAAAKKASEPEGTGVLTYDNRAKYGVMEAATESLKPVLRSSERRSARGARHK